MRRAFADGKIRDLKMRNQTTLDLIRPEFQRLCDEVDVLKHQFIATDDEPPMGLLMSMTTRKKIHAQLDAALHKLKDGDANLDLTRLRVLVPLHIKQLQKMDAANVEQNRTFYVDMLSTLEREAHWLNTLKQV